MSNYIVVLFKDKKKKRIIKEYKTLKGANSLYKKLLTESSEVIFDVLYENGVECKFELGIVELSNKQLIPVYMTDELGRNVKVKLEDEGMTLFMISPYRKQEHIYDIQKKKKISVEIFLRTYMRGSEMKMLYSLNNKVILQIDSSFFLFSLKNSRESNRFIDCISNYYLRNKKGDCLFIKDNSSAQRKYLLGLLSSNGVDKKILYRKTTTHPRLK